MRSSPFVPRTALAALLSYASTAVAQAYPGGRYFAGNGAPGASPYELVDDYPALTFFDKFHFYDQYDPTYGHVKYVNQTVATQNGLAYYSSQNNTAVMRPDSTNVWPRGGQGRPAVRVISDSTYDHGLFIADVKHMPWGCGTWPAYWLLGQGPQSWPAYGEIGKDSSRDVQTFD